MLHGAGGTGGLPPSPCLHPVVDAFLFYANLSFSYAVPFFFLCSMAQVGRGVSLHLHVSILLSTRFFFMLICPFLMLSPSFSYAPWRRWDGGSPSISMSPSCCRHVSFFMLICPFLMLSPSFSYAPWRRWDRGVSLHLHVSILLSTRFFFYANLSFSYAVPLLFLMLHGAGGTGGLPPSPCLHPVVDTFLFLC